MTECEKILKEALQEISRLETTGSGKLFSVVLFAKEELKKAFPNKIMTMKEAIDKGLDFKFFGEKYELTEGDTCSDATQVYSEKYDYWMSLKWILENQDKEVEIIE